MLVEIGIARLVFVVAAAGVAGFVTGLAGFGTGLVAIGLWLQVLPARLVPPLVVICSVAGQLISLPAVRHAFAWRALAPYLTGALFGVPLGVLAFRRASPRLLRPAVGLFLVAFVAFQCAQRGPGKAGAGGSRRVEAAVGAGAGFLGGFAGLSGPLLIVWLRLRGGRSDSQRAIYQPFNLLVLAAAALALGVEGRLDRTVIALASFCFPATFLGARIGVRCYRRVDEVAFRRVVLGLLFASGLALLLLR